jgi:hypothetical protein
MAPRFSVTLTTASMLPPARAWKWAASSLSTERELIVADRTPMVPAAELVRQFRHRSGGPRLARAIRAATATSSLKALLRPVRCNACDGECRWLGQEFQRRSGSVAIPRASRNPEVLVHVAPNNSMQRLEDTSKQHGHTPLPCSSNRIQGNCCSTMASVEYVKPAWISR